MTARTIITFAIVAALHATTHAAPPEAPAADIPAAPTVTTPTGAYQIASLSLEGGAPAFLALRDGKPVQFWSTSLRMPGGPEPKGSPKLLTDALRGQTAGGKTTAEIDLRLVSIWAPQTRLGTMTLSLEFTSNGGKLSGTWANKAGEKPATGSLSGIILDEAAAREANAISHDWPAFYGPASSFRGPDYGKPIVDDLAKARSVWRSESVALSGWGTGVDGRYKMRAAYGTLCGGSSSPVVADGRVYLFHFRPGEPRPQEVDAASIEKVKDNPHEVASLSRFFAKRADVVVTCMDATNGKTLWESVWPNRQGNIQTHKWRGNNPTPSIARGIIVAADYGWGLYAYDAKTGELKWSRGGGGAIASDKASIGPVISGDVVVWAGSGGTVGLDLATGKELWKAPAANSARRMVIDNAERVLLVGPTLVLIDPASGRQLAQAAFPGGVEKKGRLEIGRGAGSNLVCEGPYIVSFESVPGERQTAGNPFAMKVTGDKIETVWTSKLSAVMEDGHIGITIANGLVFTAFQRDGAFAIDLATGKTVKQIKEANADSNPIFVNFDKYILWQPECQHGRQHIQLFGATAETFGPIGTNWKPPHNDTTAYGEMPIANVIVDGRLFLRGMDGVYCYDLRASTR